MARVARSSAPSTDGAPPGSAPAGGAAVSSAHRYEVKVMTRADLEESPSTRLRPLEAPLEGDPKTDPAADPVTGTPPVEPAPETLIPDDEEEAEAEDEDGEPGDAGARPTTEEAVRL